MGWHPKTTKIGAALALSLVAIVHEPAQNNGAWLGLRSANAAESGADVSVLKRLQQAAQKLSYQGVMTVQVGPQVNTLRVVHHVDASGESEKIESLDGPPRQWLRVNDQLQSIYVDDKLIRQEKRRVNDKVPSLLNQDIDNLSAFYDIRSGAIERVAGADCQVFDLEPKDAYRFAHRFCVERQAGLLIRSQTFGEQRESLEQMVFTELRVGPIAERDRPRLKPIQEGWRLEQVDMQSVDMPLVLKETVPGFRKKSEFRRQRANGKIVHQMIYSDGLTTVSIFLEPASTAAEAPLTASSNHSAVPASPTLAHGALRSHRTEIAGWRVMVMGEVPVRTLKLFAQNLASR